MKKLLLIILSLGLFFCCFQFIINLFLKEHNINYSLISNDNKYSIKEYYVDNTYYFNIKDKYKNIYNFYYNKYYNNMDQIINKILYYKNKDLSCILPVYNKSDYNDLYCIYKNKQVSSSYLKQINNDSFNNIINKVKKSGYTIKSIDSSNKVKKKDNISFYMDNIDSNYVFTIWYYKGIYIFSNDKLVKKDMLEKDSYENNYSKLVGKYYITFNTDKKDNYRFSELISYNIIDGGFKYIEIEDNVSLNTYINGVYDNKMYFTDLDNKIEYEFDPYKGSIKKLDNYKYYNNNKFITMDKSSFFNNYKIFTNNVINNNINSQIIKYDELNYYYKTDDGKIYQVINKDYDNPILLFTLDNISDWDVDLGLIKVVSGSNLYSYTNESGLKLIAVNKELKYNYKNICDFVKKK